MIIDFGEEPILNLSTIRAKIYNFDIKRIGSYHEIDATICWYHNFLHWLKIEHDGIVLITIDIDKIHLWAELTDIIKHICDFMANTSNYISINEY